MSYKFVTHGDKSEVVFPSIAYLLNPPILYVIGKDCNGQAYSENIFDRHSRINMSLEKYNELKGVFCGDVSEN